MRRAVLILTSALGLFLAVEPQLAEAKSKAYCREWAEDVANRRANGGDVVAGAVIGALGGALLGGAIDGRDGAGKGALIGGAGGAVVTGATASERWQRIYRRAYADCRAS
ncbi:hypothetical protein [Aestuariivirga sp.]|uniref:hypothetical protein n=1 Tax=Aestuariivirga sp. TaxID=2650926 RepID=UPI00391C025F